MNKSLSQSERLLAVGMALTLCAWSGGASAVVDGITGPVFNLTAKADYISTADGNSILSWGYANGGVTMQYPGPTLIVNEGDLVTINLTNALPTHGTDAPLPASIVFPGQNGVTTSCDATAPSGSQGLLTCEAAVGQTVSYTFTAGKPGTFMYHSGTQPDLQVEMGLVGALIVRPNAVNPGQAYGHPDSGFNQEYLFLLTEMDPELHKLIESGQRTAVNMTTRHPVQWFINGRNAPDTLLDAGVPWMPTQPYNCLPRMHPGEKLLLRIINAGTDLHPFHHHGNNSWTIAHDGQLLESTPGAGPDLAVSDYTITTIPGETYDAIFEWTGKGLGWDIYGHAPGDLLQPNEYAPDHGKPFPVTLPNQLDLTNGEFWSGTPFLGQFGTLPPGSGGVNLNGGYFHMWHSHNERELTNDDIFPGGMMTMLIVEPPSVPIP